MCAGLRRSRFRGASAAVCNYGIGKLLSKYDMGTDKFKFTCTIEKQTIEVRVRRYTFSTLEDAVKAIKVLQFDSFSEDDNDDYSCTCFMGADPEVDSDDDEAQGEDVSTGSSSSSSSDSE